MTLHMGEYMEEDRHAQFIEQNDQEQSDVDQSNCTIEFSLVMSWIFMIVVQGVNEQNGFLLDDEVEDHSDDNDHQQA